MDQSQTCKKTSYNIHVPVHENNTRVHFKISSMHSFRHVWQTWICETAWPVTLWQEWINDIPRVRICAGTNTNGTRLLVSIKRSSIFINNIKYIIHDSYTYDRDYKINLKSSGFHISLVITTRLFLIYNYYTTYTHVYNVTYIWTSRPPSTWKVHNNNLYWWAVSMIDDYHITAAKLL